MDIMWKIVSLGGILILFALLAIGIKKYHVMDVYRRLTKKDKVIMIAGAGLLLLGILMQTARTEMAAGDGIVSGSVHWLADILFARNSTATSFAVTAVLLVPAVLYQVLFLEQLVMKLRISYCQIYYYMILYALNLGIYRNLDISPAELVIFLAVSAFLYYATQVMNNGWGKKGLLYLACFVVGVVLVSLLELPIHWKIYMACLVVMLEGILLAVIRAKIIIFRKTLRRLGVLLVLVLCILMNCWLW